jgi:uncharacterized membrane protein
MKHKKTAISIIIVLAATWITAFIYYGKLPEQIPTHWNFQGEIDGHMSKPWGVYLIPIISSVLSLILWYLPKIAPKGFKLDGAKKVYNIIVFVLSVFLYVIMIITFKAALDNSLNTTQILFILMGLLNVIIGNYLSKVPKNFFLGIRTPWTLASDKVWYQTHRLGSWTFILCGLLIVIAALIDLSRMVIITLLLLAVLIPAIYSLISYYKIEGFNNHSE